MMGAEGRSIAEVGWVGQCARGQRGGALWKQIARLENAGPAGQYCFSQRLEQGHEKVVRREGDRRLANERRI